MYRIIIPDHDSFLIRIVSKKEADSLEAKYLANSIEDQFLSTYKKYAYQIEKEQVLYRQFHKSIGFIFPTRGDFLKALRGESYWEVNIQPTDENNNLIVKEIDYTRIAVSFAIRPAIANNFRKNVAEEIPQYATFEGYRFYLLKDSSIAILRERTNYLSEGYWFCSIRDFDFFYYILSGKYRPV